MSVTPLRDQFSRVDELFAAALELNDAAARAAFLEQQTAGEPELRREVFSLLAADAAGAALFGEDSASLAPGIEGQRLGPYQVVEEIGRGGMATVYRARRVDGELEQTVAIKVLRRQSDELLARFRAERQTLVALRHPFIVAPLDAGTLADGRPYLVLEEVAGRPLLRYCEEEALDLETRLLLFEKVCLAVSHAHSRLVVHRDLKPSNILVDAEGQPRLLDFGVAKLLAASEGAEATIGFSAPSCSPASDLTGAAGAPFTPRYASPEQVRGEPVGVATDVYSLGVLLFELLTLLPAEGATAEPSAALRRAALTPGASEQQARRLEGDLDAVVRRARAADPALRYPSVEALREDLERRRQLLPLRARAPEGLYVAGLFLRRHRWRLAAAALVLAALLAAALLSRRAEERAVESEAIAWRAHAEAAWVTNTLAKVLAELARGSAGRAEALAALAAAERHLTEQIEGYPEAEARLRHALALAYAEIGRREEAIAHARRAAELARSTRGLGPQDLEGNIELLRRLESEEK